MARKPAETSFTKESEAAATPKPSGAMLALFRSAPVGAIGDISAIKLQRRNMPAMYKPRDIPVGATVSGVIVDIVESPVTTIKGKLLWLHLTTFSGDGKKILKTGKEITLPCTGTIRNALAPGVDGAKELTAALEKYKGKLFVGTRQEDKPSKYKKEMFMFDCFTSDANIDLDKLELLPIAPELPEPPATKKAD